MEFQLGNKLGNGHLGEKICMGKTDLFKSLKKQTVMLSGWNSPMVCPNTGLRIISNMI